ncbi:EcsC family protein [Solicola gregarius]|uniref:EcsC family protein n=1 Tax=Solicola gregarius TaxID=2908642 RepID=A0AA46TMA9_9ACTN|nr:EcsC family protein [Solicola gregarius]UYM07549.1 EcsC family protein [Solicola gregarius]
MGVGRMAAKGITPIGKKIAPKVTSGYVREILERAIDGYGPIKAAGASADARLVDAKGDVEDAIDAAVAQHVRYAGMQGFATNIGGGITLAVSIPANVTGLALLQSHLVAAIAHLRGYDLDDARVRNAILACLLGEDGVNELIKKKKLPGTPMAIATSPVHDPELDTTVARHVTTELLAKVTGRRAALVVSRRIPVLGGGVGAATDAYSTYQIGTYAREQLHERRV